MKAIKFLSLILALGVMPFSLVADGTGLPDDDDISVDYNLGTTPDAITGDNEFKVGKYSHWFIDPGADNHYVGVYERPVNQGFGDNGGVWSTNSNYFENLDIVSGSAGSDSFFFYARIEMYGTAEVDQEGYGDEKGLMHFYRVRVADLLLSSENPSSRENPTEWQTEKNKVFHDANGDRGTDGDGYELEVVADGAVNNGIFKDDMGHEGDVVLYSRIDPNNDHAVEFAFAFMHLDYTLAELLEPGIIFEANKGTTDSQNYYWSFEYNGNEAGSPNYGGDHLSEYGTQGLGNVYELDTLLLGHIPPPVIVPEPSDIVYLMGPGLLFALVGRRYWMRRRKNRKQQ